MEWKSYLSLSEGAKALKVSRTALNKAVKKKSKIKNIIKLNLYKCILSVKWIVSITLFREKYLKLSL